VNIVQIQGSAAGDLACALLYTSDDDATAEVLRSMGYSFVSGSTLVVEIEDTPCALGELTAKLANARVNVTGCCVIGRREGRAEWSISVDDEPRARAVLGIPRSSTSSVRAARLAPGGVRAAAWGGSS